MRGSTVFIASFVMFFITSYPWGGGEIVGGRPICVVNCMDFIISNSICY